MRPTIDKLIKNIIAYPSDSLDKRMDTLFDSIPTVSKLGLWRRIMRHKATRFSAAAIVLLAFSILLSNIDQFFSHTSMVYGMQNAHQLVRSARTIHTKSTVYFSGNTRHKTVEFDQWFDVEGKRWRVVVAAMEHKGKISWVEEIYNGGDTLVMVQHPEQKYMYLKLTKFQRQLKLRQIPDNMSTAIFGHKSLLNTSKIVGKEKINDQFYNIWESISTQHSASLSNKIQMWISPQNGKIAKTMLWTKRDDEVWQLSSKTSLIETNISLPDTVFDINSLSNYQAENTQDTAMLLPNRSTAIGSSDYILECSWLFALPDGSLILCWRSEKEESTVSQKPLFSHLQTGGEFPKLPYRVKELKAMYDSQEYCYQGKHLAYTQKKGKFYEWGLYIAKKPIPADQLVLCPFLCEYQSIEKIQDNCKVWCMVTATIKDKTDFNELILEAMKELSGKSSIPKLSLQKVLELAEKQRKNVFK